MTHYLSTRDALLAIHVAGRKGKALRTVRGMLRNEIERCYHRDMAGVATRMLAARVATWSPRAALPLDRRARDPRRSHRPVLGAADREFREALARGRVDRVRDSIVDVDRGVEAAIARGWLASTIHATRDAYRAADDGSRPALTREPCSSGWKAEQHWRQHETQWRSGRATTRTYAAMEITPRAYVVVSPGGRELGWVIGDRSGVARARDGAHWSVVDGAVRLVRGKASRAVSHEDLERGLLDGLWCWMPADLAGRGAVEYGPPAVRAAEIARKRRLARLGHVAASATLEAHARAARLLARLSTTITATLDDARAAGFCAAGIRSYLRAQGHPSATIMTTRDLVLSGDPRAVQLAVSVASRAISSGEVRR